MRTRLLALLLPLLLAGLVLPAGALTPEETLERQEQALKLDGLERSARENGGTAQYDWMRDWQTCWTPGRES